MIKNFLEQLRTQRWDDHRYYHHSRINQSLQPVVTRLGFRTADFSWSRYTRWLAEAKGIELAERRLIPPLGHFSLVRFRKTEIAAAA